MNKSSSLKHKGGHAKAAAIQLMLIALSFLPVLCLNWMNASEGSSKDEVVAPYEFNEVDYDPIRP